MNKGWQVQIKKLKIDLMDVRKKTDNKKHVKKLLEEKDKTVSSFKKQLKIPVTDHPQTKELLTLQKQVESL